MRFLLRSLGLVILAVGVVFAVGDIARSLADESTRLVSIGDAFASMGLGYDPARLTEPSAARLVAAVSHWSMAISCGILGFLFLVLGRRPRPAGRRRTAF